MKNELIELKVIQLPTDKRVVRGSLFKMVKELDYSKRTGDYIGKLCLSVNTTVTKSNEHWEAQHLYLTSDDKIKEGDWVYNSKRNVVELNINKDLDKMNSTLKFWSKVVVTTDKELNLPLVPKKFLEAYVKSKGLIESVQVVCEPKEVKWGHIIWTQFEVKTRGDKTAIIHEMKNFTRQEMIDFAKYSKNYQSGNNVETAFNRWVANKVILDKHE